MALEEAIRAAVLGDEAITAIIGTRLRPLRLSPGEARPYLTYQITDEKDVSSLDGATEFGTSEFEIGVFADRYADVVTLSSLIRERLKDFEEVVAGIELGTAFEGQSDIEEAVPAGEEKAICLRIQLIAAYIDQSERQELLMAAVRNKNSKLQYAPLAETLGEITEWTDLAERISIKPPKRNADPIEYVHLDSDVKGNLPGLPEVEGAEATLYYTAAQGALLDENFNVELAYRVLYPDGSGRRWFGFIMEDGMEEIENNGLLQQTVKIAASGDYENFDGGTEG